MTGKKSLFLSISLCLFMIYAVSCSQKIPETNVASASVIFEYNDYDSKGKARLSIFVNSLENVRRLENLKVINLSNGFIWNSDNVSVFSNSENMFAGYTNLVVPEGEKIPYGKYEIRFLQSDDEESVIYTDIQYDDAFYDCKALEIPDFVSSKNGKVRIAIYDSKNTLIYYGDRTEDLKDNRGIWNNYRNAEYYYDIWCTPGNKVMCIMPKEYVSNEKN